MTNCWHCTREARWSLVITSTVDNNTLWRDMCTYHAKRVEREGGEFKVLASRKIEKAPNWGVIK